MTRRINNTDYDRRFTLRYAIKSTRLGKVKTNKVPIKHTCPECSEVFLSSPDVMLNRRASPLCVKCYRPTISKKQTASLKDFIERLTDKHGERIECLRYTRMGSAADFKCLVCNREWSAKPNSLLNQKVGCLTCSVKNAVAHRKLFRPKVIRLDTGEQIKVQGFEDYAYRYIKVVKGVPENKITSGKSKIPVIPYRYKGKNRNYFPDFLVGKRIVEVKSLWTLAQEYEKNQAKAKACEKLGYKFSLLVVHRKKTYEINDFVGLTYEQTASIVKRNKKRAVVLALDPGLTNFAWAVIDVETDSLLGTGMFTSMLKKVTYAVTESLEAFCVDVEAICEQFGVTDIIAERFMSRGNKGLTIEAVNMMLGYLSAGFKRKQFRIITAAQWKNDFNRQKDLNQFYKETTTAFSITVHQVDAICIGLYQTAYLKAETPFKKDVQQIFKSGLCKKKTPAKRKPKG